MKKRESVVRRWPENAIQDVQKLLEGAAKMQLTLRVRGGGPVPEEIEVHSVYAILWTAGGAREARAYMEGYGAGYEEGLLATRGGDARGK